MEAINPTSQKEIDAFKNLIHDYGDLQIVKRDLIELYINYSRQLILHYQEGREGDDICNFGDVQNQLFRLMQVIAVCDAGSENPLLSEIIIGETKAA